MKKEKDKQKTKGHLAEMLDQLDYRSNLKFRFSALLYRTIVEEKDYGNGEQLKMLDAHILKVVRIRIIGTVRIWSSYTKVKM